MAIQPAYGYKIDPANPQKVIRDESIAIGPGATLQQPISTSALTTLQTQAKIPPAPAPSPLDTSGGQAIINTNAQNPLLSGNVTTPSGAIVNASTGAVIQEAPQKEVDSSFFGSLKEQLGLIPKPESTSDIYQSVYGVSPEQAKIDKETALTAFNTKQAAVKAAQAKFSDVQARLAAITAEATAIQIRAQKEAEGRGITAAGLEPITSGKLRDNALKAIPLQAEGLLAQAELASTQGDAELANSILQQAQGRLDDFFKAKIEDSRNDYNYKLKVIDVLFAYADKQETRQLQAKKDELTRKQKVEDDLRNFQQQLAIEATSQGQGALATKIALLDSKSATFQQDLARLQGQIKGKSTGVEPVSLAGLTPEQQNDPFIKLLANTAGGKPITDTFAQSLNKGLNVLSQIGVLQMNIKDTNTGPILGAFRGANPWDTNAQTIKAQLNAIVPNLARGVFGEVGVLTDNDITQYSKTLPNLTSTEAIRNAILGITVDLIGKSIKRTLEINAANQKDVSGFIDIYTEMIATRDSIFSQIPGYKGQTQSLSSLGISKEEENIFDTVTGSTPQTISGGFFSNFLKGLTGQ